MLKRLDITKIKTVEDLNSVNFSEYVDKHFLMWVRYIVFPIKTESLNRICELSTKEGSKVTLGWSMGELYYKTLAIPQIKKLKQMTFPNMS